MRRQQAAGRITFLARLLWLCSVLAAGSLAGACLQCDPAYKDKFSYYQKNMNWKTWWAGDRETSQQMLENWPEETLKGLKLTISPEIPQDKLKDVGEKIYEKLDNMYKEFMYTPGAFPKLLRSILETQNDLLQKAIVETRIDCEKHCGVYEYETVSCESCNITLTPCFGYHCKSTEKWKMALQSLPEYMAQLPVGHNRLEHPK
ncbi:izumo sperm-egg fusion protein 4 [Ambystoma mexicanum]|uniref:izumo sperm-egg fusion protein 4 n=1 Tax=Ambystoma mexicanum TaxID=8296 RepID=UPI0037E718EF